MSACPRCGRPDDGTSYQCPDCFTVLQPDLAKRRAAPGPQAPPTAGGPPQAGVPGPGAAPPPAVEPGKAPPFGRPGSPGGPPAPGQPGPHNPYQAPGAPVPQGYPGYGGNYRAVGVPDVPTYLPHAILATLFCCLPFGIAAIVYAAKVGTMQAVGDYEGAVKASDQARMWCWISFGCGLVGTILYLIFMFSMAGGARQY